MTADVAIDAALLGWDRIGLPFHVADFREWGLWLFPAMVEHTELGRAIVRLLIEPTEAEIARGRYLEITPREIAEMKNAFLQTGLCPWEQIALEFAAADI